MELIISSVQVIHVIVSVLLILVVLLQPGKSGNLGSIFGGGTSESVFGAAGAVPFLSKLTRGLAVLFMLTSLALGYFAAKGMNKSVVTDMAPTAVERTVPETTIEGLDVVPENEVRESAAGEAAENAQTTDGESAVQPESASKEGEASPESAETAETAAETGDEGSAPAPEGGAENNTQ